MRPLCILVTGSPVPKTLHRAGGFASLLRDATGEAWQGVWLDVDAQMESVLPSPSDLSGVIVTGSASSVTERARWMLLVESWLRELVAARTPVLGVCFGHQILAQALGGEVQRNPRGREMGTVELEVMAKDVLFGGEVGATTVNMSHCDSVVRLPPGAELLARTTLEPHAALRFAPRAWGVQFHPEFDLHVMREYIEERGDLLRGEGLDPKAMHESARDCPAPRALLQGFAALCSQ
jgi:GMP synthase (glutamine-hydrolysing)